MKATLSAGGVITLIPETDYETNFIAYWCARKYTIEPKIRFHGGGFHLHLIESMPDRGVNEELITEWAMEAKRLSHQAFKDNIGENNRE